jgi:predicted SnoaL-like aldol condensation-catalyzing enzyme
MGTPEENKRVVLRRIEALNAGDAEALARLEHPDFYEHEAEHDDGGRIDPLDIVAEDDRVVVRARVRGGSAQQVHIWRLAAGLIVEHWCVGDTDDQDRGNT